MLGNNQYLVVDCQRKNSNKNDSYLEPLTINDDNVSHLFLNGFIDWLDAWKKMNLKTGTLTWETHESLYMTT